MPAVSTEGPVIDAAIKSLQPNSPLVGSGTTFAAAGKAYDVDWRLLVGIGVAETSLATYGPAQRIHNPFGIGPNKPFTSYNASITYLAKLLRDGYISKGRTSVAAIYPLYVNGDAKAPPDPNSQWSRNVSSVMTRFGGDPGKVSEAAGTSIVGDAKDAAGGITDVLGLIAKLFDPALWLRVVAIIGGGALVLVALVMIFRGQLTGGLARGIRQAASPSPRNPKE